MKIVRNSNRWLKKLTRAAALMSLALGTVSAVAQDAGFPAGAQPTGVVTGTNRSGMGAAFRAGHSAGDTVGRYDSLSHIQVAPFISDGNQILFGDTRLGRANEGGLVWSFGSGYRYYIEDWDVVIGGNGYYDRDHLSGAYLNQWGAGAELLAREWEWRGNYYQTFGDTFSRTGQAVRSGSSAFDGSNLTYTRVDSFVEGLSGFDSEFGVLLPGKFAERFDVRVFGGGYFFEGDRAEGFGGWSARLQSDVGGWLELGLKLTDDETFGTNLCFTAVVHAGGFRSQEHLERSAIQRFRDPVRRSLNVVTVRTDDDVPGQLAINPTNGLPFSIAHVNSNYNIGPFLGTVDAPYQSLQQGLASGSDIVFTHAGSSFSAGPENTVSLVTGQQLLGEGMVVAGRNTETFIEVLTLGNRIPLQLPASPTFAADPTLSRPDLLNSAGPAVTLADNVQFSGFTITNPATLGIFSDGAANTLINDVTISGAGQTAMLLQNTRGATSISNTSLVSAGSASGALLHIDGGAGDINFASTDALLLGTISNTAAQPAVLLENMTAGRFLMDRSSVSDDGGAGVVISNNLAGSATIDNLVSTNASGNAVLIQNSGGNYAFSNSNTQLTGLTITGSSGPGIMIDGLTGSANFNLEVDIVDRIGAGIEIARSSGTTTFAQEVTLTDQTGAGIEAGISVLDNQSGNLVEFRDGITISSTAVLAGSPERTNGSGLSLAGNDAGSLFRASGTTTINGTDLASVIISADDGNTEFLGEVLVNNRLAEGILISGSGGTIEFGNTDPRRVTLVNNELLSGSPAISLQDNTGVVSFGEATIVGATGNPGGGAGVDAQGNTGLINFIDMDINSVAGTGFFGANNRLIRITDGVVDSTDETAIDIENSGIDIRLESVTSIDSPDYGIRLVETNSDDGRSFMIRPTGNTLISPGNGGTISGAAGAAAIGDAAGIYLSNAGQVEVREMILSDNEVGVRVENTESWLDGSGNVIVVADRDEQYFRLEYSTVFDSHYRGIETVDLMGLLIENTSFDNNGADAATGYETIHSLFTVSLDDTDAVDTYSRSERPFEILIQNSSFTSNQHDVIRITQTNGAAGAAIRTQLYDNIIEALDTTDPTTPDPLDSRPLFDDGLVVEWNGPAQLFIEGNSFDMQGAEDQVAFLFDNSSGTDLTELSLKSNQIFINNLGTSAGAVTIDLLGDYDMGSPDGVFDISGNLFSVSGQTPTAMYLVLPPSASSQIQRVAFIGNQITLEDDGGTGIEIRRTGDGARFTFGSNLVSFYDLGNAQERGFVFSQLSGPIRLGGLGNRMQVLSVGVNGGNGQIEQPLLIPTNAAIGQTEINGVLFP